MHSTKSEYVIQQQLLFIYMWNISANTAWFLKIFIFTNSIIYEYKIPLYQVQGSDQFLATTKLATNKAICLKTKKMNKNKMYF